MCRQDDKLLAFLYIKIEQENENYSDISPVFPKKKRLKIGTFKVAYNGFKLGERFLKIIFDNAVRSKVSEIYVTIFNKRLEQQRLINLLEKYGFVLHGSKGSFGELVYVRDFSKNAIRDLPKQTFPYISTKGSIFIVPVYPEYHTNLLPDSILNTESPANYVENKPFRNAISKVYISRSIERNLRPSDLIIFYRTGGDRYRSVITTIGIVEAVYDGIADENEFIMLCGKRSVFSTEELKKHWNYNVKLRPFVVDFLYVYSFPKRINRERLLQLKIQALSVPPRGFTRISLDDFKKIVKETGTDESIIIY